MCNWIYSNSTGGLIQNDNDLVTLDLHILIYNSCTFPNLIVIYGK